MVLVVGTDCVGTTDETPFGPDVVADSIPLTLPQMLALKSSSKDRSQVLLPWPPAAPPAPSCLFMPPDCLPL